MSVIETIIDIPAEHEKNVCGQFDSYLKKIERTLHVTMIERDGALKIIGPEQMVQKAKSVFMWILQMNWRWKKTGHQFRTFCSTKKQGITGSIFLQKEHSDIMHRRMHICPA